MITIDGKEAGGQILRTSLGLSAVTGKPIRIVNIRGARQGGVGLKTQHLEGVLGVAELCNAEVKGVKLGSNELEFIPKKLEAKELDIIIPTAGSIALLFQSLQVAAAFTGDMVKFNIKGGSTASSWSPTIHYTKNVFLPIVRKMGYNAEIGIIKEAFYPKGGAEVEITVHPVKKLQPLKLLERGKVNSIKGISVVGSLPEDIAKRQANSAKKTLVENNYPDAQIEKKVINTTSPGTSITLWAECENTLLGADVIGERGKLAEKVGEEAALELIKSLESNASLDKWMTDQIIPFLALANGMSEIKIEELTEHCKTNMLIVEKILESKFDVDLEKRIVAVKGINF